MKPEPLSRRLAAASRTGAPRPDESSLRPIQGRVRSRIGPGSTLDDYVLEDLIGEGGMGEVYRARRRSDGRVAAVKVMRATLARSAGNLKRFAREVAALSELESPYIVHVFGWGASVCGRPYLVMELLDGVDLSVYLQRRGRLRPEEVLQLVTHLASALDTAHAAGIVHRDVKPRNIVVRLVGGRLCWKILDFGVAKALGVDTTLTANNVIGTPSYMSPEQALGEPIDSRSDVFALAAVTYRALTGRTAFDGDRPVDVVFNVVHAQPRRPSALAQVSHDVDLVLALGLAKQVTARLPSAESFRAAFEAALHARLGGELRHRAHRLLRALPWAEETPCWHELETTTRIDLTMCPANSTQDTPPTADTGTTTIAT